METLTQSRKKSLRFPPNQLAPKTSIKKPESGCYHLIRFIRSDCKLNIFGEHLRLSPALQYEYVVATIDVKKQKLELFHDQFQVDEFDYTLR